MTKRKKTFAARASTVLRQVEQIKAAIIGMREPLSNALLESARRQFEMAQPHASFSVPSELRRKSSRAGRSGQWRKSTRTHDIRQDAQGL